jgi:DNA-binding IclR family transcriptional regulator
MSDPKIEWLSETQRLVVAELRRPQAGCFTVNEIAAIFRLSGSQALECLESLTELGLARRIQFEHPAIWCAALPKDAP